MILKYFSVYGKCFLTMCGNPDHGPRVSMSTLRGLC